MEPGDLERIADGTGATAILSLQHDECLDHWDIDEAAMRRAGKRLGLTMRRCPIRDFDIPDMRRRLPDAVATLAALRTEASLVYVHCTAGLGRAPLTVLGYLTFVEGLPPDEAIQTILAGRPGAVPAWEAYHGCREDLTERHRPAIERRAYALYEAGVHEAAQADWDQARAEVLRDVLTARGARGKGTCAA